MEFRKTPSRTLCLFTALATALLVCWLTINPAIAQNSNSVATTSVFDGEPVEVVNEITNRIEKNKSSAIKSQLLEERVAV